MLDLKAKRSELEAGADLDRIARGADSEAKVPAGFCPAGNPLQILSSPFLFALRSIRTGGAGDPGTVWAVPDDQTQVPTCPQCSLMLLDGRGTLVGPPC